MGQPVPGYAVPRKSWLHGEAQCPACRLPLDPTRDLQTYEQNPGSSLPAIAVGTHTRCGTPFRLELTG